MARATESSDLSRDQIVDRMNVLAQRYGAKIVGGNAKGLSRATLEKWLSTHPQYYPNLAAVTIFCAVVDNLAPLAAMAKPLEAIVIGEPERTYLEWGRRSLEVQSLKREMDALKKRVS